MEVDKVKKPIKPAPHHNITPMDMGLILAWLCGLTTILVTIVALVMY